MGRSGRVFVDLYDNPMKLGLARAFALEPHQQLADLFSGKPGGCDGKQVEAIRNRQAASAETQA
jgi:hypothetical protein